MFALYQLLFLNERSILVEYPPPSPLVYFSQMYAKKIEQTKFTHKTTHTHISNGKTT